LLSIRNRRSAPQFSTRWSAVEVVDKREKAGHFGDLGLT
jgi:hypothetical protein